jgi:hypothetical protein
MKTIYKGKDDLYYVLSIKSEDGTVLTKSELDALVIEFFVGNTKITKTLEDITSEGILHVNSSELETLDDGPLKARFFIKLPDSGFDDQSYDQTAERLTGFFIKTLPANNQ